VLAATVLIEFHEVALNPGDLDLLGHRPIPPRTYAAARLTNLLFYLGLIYLALHLIPLLVGAGLRDAAWWFAPAYLAASLAGSLVTAAVVILLLSLGGAAGRLEPLKDILAWTQIILLLVIGYGAQLLFRAQAPAVLVWGAFPPPWVAYLPSTWLARFVEAAQTPGLDTLLHSLLLLAVAVAACGVTLGRLTRLYRTMQPTTVVARRRPMAKH